MSSAFVAACFKCNEMLRMFTSVVVPLLEISLHCDQDLYSIAGAL